MKLVECGVIAPHLLYGHFKEIRVAKLLLRWSHVMRKNFLPVVFRRRIKCFEYKKHDIRVATDGTKNNKMLIIYLRLLLTRTFLGVGQKQSYSF